MFPFKFIKLTEKQREYIYQDLELDEFDYERVYTSKWIDEGKIDTCDVIFKKDDKHYRFTMYRYGDCYKGYEYEFYDNVAIEVEEVEVTIKEWRNVKNG